MSDSSYKIFSFSLRKYESNMLLLCFIQSQFRTELVFSFIFLIKLNDLANYSYVTGHSLKLMIAFHFVFSCFEGYNATILAYGQVAILANNMHL